jgi:hypothetical protein
MYINGEYSVFSLKNHVAYNAFLTIYKYLEFIFFAPVHRSSLRNIVPKSAFKEKVTVPWYV